MCFLKNLRESYFQNHKTLLIANIYEANLRMFKSFILIFEQKIPQVHKRHLTL